MNGAQENHHHSMKKWQARPQTRCSAGNRLGLWEEREMGEVEGWRRRRRGGEALGPVQGLKPRGGGFGAVTCKQTLPSLLGRSLSFAWTGLARGSWEKTVLGLHRHLCSCPW